MGNQPTSQTDSGLPARNPCGQFDDCANDAIRIHHVLDMLIGASDVGEASTSIIALCADLTQALAGKINGLQALEGVRHR